jgi:hypothetical protein
MQLEHVCSCYALFGGSVCRGIACTLLSCDEVGLIRHVARPLRAQSRNEYTMFPLDFTYAEQNTRTTQTGTLTQGMLTLFGGHYAAQPTHLGLPLQIRNVVILN